MTTQEQIQYLPIDRIVAEQQARETFGEDSLHGLMLSLREVGQLVPLRVRKAGDKFVIVDGERRYRAARKLGLSTLAAIVEAKDVAEGEVLQKQLISNVQRDDLLPLEKAKAIRRLMDVTKWTASAAASKLGISNANLSRLLALLELPEDIQARVASGAIPASSAYQLAKVGDPAKQAELAQQVASGLTRDALVGARKAASRTKDEASAKSVSRVTAMLGVNKSVTVSGQSLSLDDFVALLEECLAKVRVSRTKGHSLSTFIRICKDTAHAA
ncbi:MAG: ParB/RepB/Spo0J family partition protein [Planctomycetaceae bacterium]|nr:ParB/RepB/Spo0J family partition protein [Planctomycetaceae bacterium]